MPPVANPQAPPWTALPPGLHILQGRFGDAAPYGFAAALAAATGGALLWATAGRPAHGRVYPWGLRRFGVDPDRLLLVEARKPVDALWALEEGLRSGAVGAVIGDRLGADMIATRRLHLAAAGRTAHAFLVEAERGDALAAATRWRIHAAPQTAADARPGPRWHAELLRNRHGPPGAWLLEWDDASLRLRLSADAADRPVATAPA